MFINICDVSLTFQFFFPMAPIWIYSPIMSARLQYVLEEVFFFRYNTGFRWTNDQEAYRRWAGKKLNYSSSPLTAGEVWIPSGPFLFTSEISSDTPEVGEYESIPAFFFLENRAGADFPFDLLALVFFQLSRYEEYQDFLADRHGRFPASASLAAKNGFLEIPLVDIWLNRLAEKLSLPPSKAGFSFLPTFDIDQAWAFRYKPLWRILGGALRGGRLLERLSVWTGLKKDPFDVYDFIVKQHAGRGVKPLFFFLLSDGGPFDKNQAHTHPAMQSLIRGLDEFADLGIHPSYRSFEDPSLTGLEKNRLELIIGKSVTKSRQHFLRIRLPETYRALAAAGIEEDYSMGYADAVGFRAGTSYPFRWYDLEREAATALRIIPFQAMDVTLRQYMGLSPEEALGRLMRIGESVRRYGGQFCTLWHNSSFDETGEWKGWTLVYTRLLEETSFFLPLRKDDA
jgi:hypothetical protein